MSNNEKLYLAPERLYRIGNASSPQTTRVRPGEIDMYDFNGVAHVMDNGKGISLFNREGLDSISLAGWVWEIDVNAQFPIG